MEKGVQYHEMAEAGNTSFTIVPKLKLPNNPGIGFAFFAHGNFKNIEYHNPRS